MNWAHGVLEYSSHYVRNMSAVNGDRAYRDAQLLDVLYFVN